MFEPISFEHGGRLRRAALQYDIPHTNWLDLSTGINPNGWSVPEVPAEVWLRLPEQDDGLIAVATQYYQTDHFLPVAGSQAAIQCLPTLRNHSRVAITHPGYKEHLHAWQHAGHDVTLVSETQINQALGQTDVLVLINPNNPTGHLFSVEQLLEWQQYLAKRDGWLVVDEAFIDITPEYSLTRYSPREGLIVLRSLGKFFGLAGVRLGFVFTSAKWLHTLHERLGPWAVNHPARWLASHALMDRQWHDKARHNLIVQGKRLAKLLANAGLTISGGCGLFQWVCTPLAKTYYDLLAQQGILIRYFEQPLSLRFGLPKQEKDWLRLEKALSGLPLAKGLVCDN